MANNLTPPDTSTRGGSRPVTRASDGRTKLAQDVKEAFHQAFMALQKSKNFSLVAWAKKHPTDFYKLCQRFVPQDLNVSGSVALQVVTGVPGIIDGEAIPDAEIVTGGGAEGDTHDPAVNSGIKADFIDDGSDLL